MIDDLKLTRQMWQLLEPMHAVLYYAPEVFDEAATLGYDTDTRWPSYFAWRSAPLGAAGPHLVTATYYSFSPRMVGEYIPAAWSIAPPEQVLAARLRAVDRALRALLGDRLDNADLPWPQVPHLILWQAATVLREHRGDGHIAVLQAMGLDPCEALVSFAAVGAAPVDVFASRGWTDQEWSAARERLTALGWMNPDGSATERGREGREEVERRTDELAAAPWRALGPARAGRLAQLVVPVMQAIVASGMLPRQSTLGMNRASTATHA